MGVYERIARLVKGRRGVSPVVGTILMIAITVVLAATVYLWVSHMSSPKNAAPQINLQGTFSANDQYLNLTVISVQGNPTWQDLKIIAVNQTGATLTVTAPTSGLVQAGQQISITGFSKGDQVTVKIIYVPSNSIIYTNTWNVP